jgi:hypothetical protein
VLSCVVTDVSEERMTSIFRVKSKSKPSNYYETDSEGVGHMFLLKLGEFLLDKTSRPRRQCSSNSRGGGGCHILLLCLNFLINLSLLRFYLGARGSVGG